MMYQLNSQSLLLVAVDHIQIRIEKNRRVEFLCLLPAKSLCLGKRLLLSVVLSSLMTQLRERVFSLYRKLILFIVFSAVSYQFLTVSKLRVTAIIYLTSN